MGFFEEISSKISAGEMQTKDELELEKKRLAKKYALKRIPLNSEILEKTGLDSALLLTKPTRTLSGVSVVAIMTKPSECPGECIYCPAGESAQSYTGYEPAAMRASQMGFDAERQAENRIRQLSAIGHPVDKIELIVMGGTFTAMPADYREQFVLGAFDALNGKKSKTLAEAHSLNEAASHRCVGLTFEVRPDYCREAHVGQMLSYGATRVELGVQTIYNEVYKRIRRGHTVEDVIEATQLLKDCGLKVLYHMMPGLPFSGRDMDIEMFKTIFSDPGFMPDMLKIYPCLLAKQEYLRTPELHDMYRNGEWHPLTNEEAVSLIADATAYFPKWMRVMRMMRDIPRGHIEAGVTAGNLHEMVRERVPCDCIRCREIGRNTSKGKPQLKRMEYGASRGKEAFISYEDDAENLYAFLRLRQPYETPIKQLEGAALVRELHVYGKEARIGEKGTVQHRGLGKALLAEAERIASEWGMKRIAVTSGVGVRPYYKALGYGLEGFHMVKAL